MSDLSTIASPDFFSGVTNVVTALTALIAAVASFISLLQSRTNGRAITAVHDATNSRMDELLAETRESSAAKGYKQANDEAKANGNK